MPGRVAPVLSRTVQGELIVLDAIWELEIAMLTTW